MNRVCPNCHAKLGSYDHFFCTSCGAKLPPELIKTDGSFLRVANFAATSDKHMPVFKWMLSELVSISEKLNLKGVSFYAIGLVLLMGVLFWGLNKYFPSFVSFTSNTKIQNTKPVQYTKNVVESSSAWDTNTFGVDRIMEYVPFNASIVIEGNDLAKFASEYSLVDPAYKTLSDQWKGKLVQHFALFANKINEGYVWSVIVFPAERNFNISSDIINAYPWLKFWVNDPIVLVTPNESVLTSVIDAKGRTAKNFSQTPVYASAKSLLPKNGKAVVFVLDSQAEKYLIEIMNAPGLTDDLKSGLMLVTKKSSDFTAIL